MKIIVLSLLFAAFPFTALRDAAKVEAVGAFADQTASESVRSSLEQKGHRVTLPDGSTLCEIWLRKGVPTRAKTETSGAFYSELSDSAVIAVVSFPKGGFDFRGQAIKPGAYTLRYSLHPTDGNHLGISPYRDFLLLVPVGLDQNVESQYKFEDLVKMSAKTNGGNHPSPLSLISPEGSAATAAVSENGHGHLVFKAALKTSSGADLPVALVVKGVAEQ